MLWVHSFAPVAAKGQALCPGDVDGSGQVLASDVEALVRALFVSYDDGAFPWNADANLDAKLTVADVGGTIRALGYVCAAPSPGRSPSPTGTPTSNSSGTAGTRTPTATATPTATFTPTPSPTPVCVVQRLVPGQTMDGSLASTDCTRLIHGTVRTVDAYEVVATAGNALRVTVTGAGGLSKPWVAVVDPNGQFQVGSGLPPADWTVMPGKPYLLYITSDPSQPQQFGSYRLTLTARPCPTPRAINLRTGFALSNLVLASNDCPDPAALFTGGSFDPVHVYTFEVLSVPTQVSVEMRQLVEDDPLDPYFVIVGPDGTEVVPAEQVDDAGGGTLGTNAAARFLAIKPGTYTMYAGGGLGRYALIVSAPSCSQRALSQIPSDRPLVCAGQAGPGCQGTLYGDRSRGTCGGPLPVNPQDEAPSVNAGADLYRFTAQAGDVVSLALEVDGDDGYALLLGPSTLGYPVVAYASSFLSDDGATELGATLTQGGTYLLSLGNVSPLNPPDASVEDPGDEYPYGFYLQKCPLAGVLPLDGPSPLRAAFTASDCTGAGSVPLRSYALSARAGQLVVLAMTGEDSIDAHLRLWGPDNSVSENDNVAFALEDPTAVIVRLIPTDGTYFVEASTSPLAGPLDPRAANRFALRAFTCPTRPLNPGIVSSVFGPDDCKLPDGRPFEVFTLDHDGSGPQVASVSFGDNVCFLALLPNGETIPRAECGKNLLEIPLVQAGTYALVVASETAAHEPYSFLYRRCVASPASYGDRKNGTLTSLSCLAADGVRADWYWLAGTEGLVSFNEGLSGLVESLFPARVAVVTGDGFVEFDRLFAVDVESMFRLVPEQRGALVRVRGVNGSGAYTLVVDPAMRRR